MNGSKSSLALGCALALTPDAEAYPIRQASVDFVVDAIEAADRNYTHAARALGISLRTLSDWRTAYPELDRVGKRAKTRARKKSTG